MQHSRLDNYSRFFMCISVCVHVVYPCLPSYCAYMIDGNMSFLSTGFKMTCMRSELLKEATVMFIDPDWIISSHDVLKVNEMFTQSM